MGNVIGRPKGSKDVFARERRSIARRRKALVSILETADRSVDRLNAEAMLQAQDATSEFYKRAEQALTAVTDLAAAAKEIEKLTAEVAKLKTDLAEALADVARAKVALKDALGMEVSNGQ